MDAYCLSDIPKEWEVAPDGSVQAWMEEHAYNKGVCVSHLEFEVRVAMPDSELALEYFWWHEDQDQRDLVPISMESAITFSDTYGASNVAAMEHSLRTLGKPSPNWCGITYCRKLCITFCMMNGEIIRKLNVEYTDKLHELADDILTEVATATCVEEDDIELSFVRENTNTIMDTSISLSRAGVSDQGVINVIVTPMEPPPPMIDSSSDDALGDYHHEDSSDSE